MQFRPVCTKSRRNASFFCVYDKCSQQPFICKYCESEQCSKAHIHKPNTYIMSCPIQSLKLPISKYEKIIYNQLTIIQDLQQRLNYLLDELKEYITNKILEIKRIEAQQISNTISQLNTQKFNQLTGRKLNSLVNYLDLISQIPIDNQMKKKSASLNYLMDNLEKCLKNFRQFEKMPESIPFFKLDSLKRKLEDCQKDNCDNKEKPIIKKKMEEIKKKQKINQKKLQKLKQKISYIEEKNNYEIKNFNNYQKNVDSELNFNQFKVNNRKRWDDDVYQQENQITNQSNLFESSFNRSDRKNVISLFRYPKNPVFQENVKSNANELEDGNLNQPNLIINLDCRVLEEEQSY